MWLGTIASTLKVRMEVETKWSWWSWQRWLFVLCFRSLTTASKIVFIQTQFTPRTKLQSSGGYGMAICNLPRQLSISKVHEGSHIHLTTIHLRTTAIHLTAALKKKVIKSSVALLTTVLPSNGNSGLSCGDKARTICIFLLYRNCSTNNAKFE